MLLLSLGFVGISINMTRAAYSGKRGANLHRTLVQLLQEILGDDCFHTHK